MMFQKVNTPNGIVVEALMMEANGSRHWHPLRNFGWSEGDAEVFRQYDCPKLTDAELKLLIRNYHPDIKYIRISRCQFKKQTSLPSA